MKPFLRYFGAKYRIAKHYGPPKHECVIEPFAGGAGYSCYWEPKKVILIEKDPCVYGIWNWLINSATYDEIMSLDGNLVDFENCDYPQHIKDFIGFWMCKGDTKPRKKMPPMIQKEIQTHHTKNELQTRFWGDGVIKKIANNIHKIKHWEIIHGDYTDAPDIDAHWHIDPPYQHQKTHYVCSSKDIDFEHLGEWCLSRKGYGEICEAEPADWLDFDVFRTTNNRNQNTYNELIYRINNKINGNLFEGDI